MRFLCVFANLYVLYSDIYTSENALGDISLHFAREKGTNPAATYTTPRSALHMTTTTLCSLQLHHS